MAPSRTIKITIKNNTTSTLELNRSTLDHGIWTSSLEPPKSIAPNTQAWFQTESAGIMTGCQGNVTYKAGDAGQFKLSFDNPFSGSNDYDETTPGGLKIERSGGGGDDASVTWTIAST